MLTRFYSRACDRERESGATNGVGTKGRSNAYATLILIRSGKSKRKHRDQSNREVKNERARGEDFKRNRFVIFTLEREKWLPIANRVCTGFLLYLGSAKHLLFMMSSENEAANALPLLKL